MSIDDDVALPESKREGAKLLATALNTLGANTVIAGFVVPLVAALYDLTSAPKLDRLLPVCLIWPLAGLVLHLFGRLVLKGLDP